MGSTAPRRDARVPSRGCSQDHRHARSRSRSDHHARSAAPPSRHSFKAAQSRVAWRDDGSLDRVDVRRDILPKLQSLPVRVISEAMGASISHGSKVRSRLLVPHKRHWNVLARVSQL